MRAKPLPDVEYLSACLSYDPHTGDLVWKNRPRAHFPNGGVANWNARFAGTTAGYDRRDGYLGICLNKREHMAHLIAYTLAYGKHPTGRVYHVNDDNMDNSKDNLGVRA